MSDERGFNRDEERRLFSTIRNARELINKLDRMSVKFENNGLRIKLIKLWPLTLDIWIKDS